MWKDHEPNMFLQDFTKPKDEVRVLPAFCPLAQQGCPPFNDSLRLSCTHHAVEPLMSLMHVRQAIPLWTLHVRLIKLSSVFGPSGISSSLGPVEPTRYCHLNLAQQQMALAMTSSCPWSKVKLYGCRRAPLRKALYSFAGSKVAWFSEADKAGSFCVSSIRRASREWVDWAIPLHKMRNSVGTLEHTCWPVHALLSLYRSAQFHRSRHHLMSWWSDVTQAIWIWMNVRLEAQITSCHLLANKPVTCSCKCQ